MFSTECRRFFSLPMCRLYKWYNSKISLSFLCLAGFFPRSVRFCYSAVITSNHEFQLAWIMLTEKNRHQQHLNVRRACTFGVSVRFFSSVGTQFLFILFSIDSITNHWLTLANESEKNMERCCEIGRGVRAYDSKWKTHVELHVCAWMIRYTKKNMITNVWMWIEY